MDDRRFPMTKNKIRIKKMVELNKFISMGKVFKKRERNVIS